MAANFIARVIGKSIVQKGGRLVVEKVKSEARANAFEPGKEEVKDELKQQLLESVGLIDERDTVGVFRALAEGAPEFRFDEFGNVRFTSPKKLRAKRGTARPQEDGTVRDEYPPMWDADP